MSTLPTFEIAGNDVTDEKQDRSASVKLNSADFTLIDPAVAPALGDDVIITDPDWAGVITGLDSLAYRGDVPYIKVRAKNLKAIQDLGAAAFNLSDTPNGSTTFGYKDLMVSRILDTSTGIEEVRATCIVFQEGLFAGNEVDITSAVEGFSAETFTIMDLTTEWPVADGASYYLDLGLGAFATATTGGADGGPLSPPDLHDTISDIGCGGCDETGEGGGSDRDRTSCITDTYSRTVPTPVGLTTGDAVLGTSDSGDAYAYDFNADADEGVVIESVDGQFHFKAGDFGSEVGFPAHYPAELVRMVDALRTENSGVLTLTSWMIVGVPWFDLTIGHASIEFSSDITGSGGGPGIRLIRGTGGGQVETASFTFTRYQPYRVRWEDGAARSRVRIWSVSDDEPTTWLETNSNATGLSFNDDLAFNFHLNDDGRGEVFIDNLDIAGRNACAARDGAPITMEVVTGPTIGGGGTETVEWDDYYDHYSDTTTSAGLVPYGFTTTDDKAFTCTRVGLYQITATVERQTVTGTATVYLNAPSYQPAVGVSWAVGALIGLPTVQLSRMVWCQPGDIVSVLVVGTPTDVPVGYGTLSIIRVK